MTRGAGQGPDPAPLKVNGTIRVPGDKSISHRSLIFSALAHGESRVRNILDSADVRATARALSLLGASVPPLSPDLRVQGVGSRFRTPASTIDCANSGTTTRLVAGLVAGVSGCEARFEGDASLSRRPMRRIARPLTQMGARFVFEGAEGHEGLPMRVQGAALSPINWQSEQASAQIKGAILLAALVSGVEAEVHEPHRSRDHTERMLAARGVTLDMLPDGVRLAPRQSVAPLDVLVPADPSSAAFFAALAALADEGELRLPDVCLNPTRTGAFAVLQRMGARIHVEDERELGGELVGTVVVSPGELKGTDVGGDEVPSCIDELPLLACVATRATGEMRMTGASELRVKESDRIRAVVENLRAIGAEAEELPDGMRVVGRRGPLAGRIVTHGDHRLAMAFGILASLPGNAILIDDPGCVAVSYPTFWGDLAIAIGPMPQRQEPVRGDTQAIPLKPRLVIAIDGPAASGKSSTAQWVAHRLGVRHVDSGAFYRALTALGLRASLRESQWTAECLLTLAPRVSLHLTERSVVPLIDGSAADEELRGSDVTRHVSSVAQMPDVRRWVNDRVRDAAATSDVVVDGRDIGTTVFPEAALKVFLVADPWERARRRLVQRLGRRPSDLEVAEETEALVDRDARDATQSVPARDAITVDTTTLTQEEQVERIVALASATRDRLAERGTLRA